jgi:hypothetical protein
MMNDFLKVLRFGYCVENPVFWKKVQMILVCVAGFLPFLATIFPSLNSVIEADVLNKLSAGIAGLVVYLTAATTDKMGV